MDNNKKAKVTILLTVYNRMSVSNTIDSILRQTFKDFELLIVDNASDDGTYEKLLDYAKTDPRVRVVRNEKNMGQTYSLHRGMDLAQSDYIARIDADDLMREDRLEKQATFLDKNPDYGFCGSWVQIITDEDKLAFIVRTPSTDKGMRTLLKISCPAYHPSVMMRKQTLDENGIKYDKNLIMAEDYDMWRQILNVSKGCNIPEPLTYYRRGATSDSDSHRKTTRKEDFLVREKASSGEYEGKEFIDKLLVVEKKDKKRIFTIWKAWRLYNRFLKSNLTKKDDDYSVIKERIKSRFLGEYIVYNNTLLAKLLTKLYNFIKKIKYKQAK